MVVQISEVYMKNGFIILCLLYSVAGLACVEIPNNLTLSGATFSEKYQMNVGRNCGFLMALESMSDLTGRQKRADEMSAWVKLNPVPNRSTATPEDIKKYVSDKRAEDAILKKKYPETFYSVKSDNGKICLNANCIPQNVVLDDGSGPKGIITITSDGSAYIYSVDQKGHSDPNLSYIRISPRGPKSALLESMQNGTVIGNMNVEAAPCSNSLTHASGSLELSGKSYTSTNDGCSGGFDSHDFERSTQSNGGGGSTGTNGAVAN